MDQETEVELIVNGEPALNEDKAHDTPRESSRSSRRKAILKEGYNSHEDNNSNSSGTREAQDAHSGTEEDVTSTQGVGTSPDDEKQAQDNDGLDHDRLRHAKQAKIHNISNPQPAMDEDTNGTAQLPKDPTQENVQGSQHKTTTPAGNTIIDPQLLAQIIAQITAQVSGQFQLQLAQQQQSYEGKLQSLQAALDKQSKQQQQATSFYFLSETKWVF